jgi:hypothetical protein
MHRHGGHEYPVGVWRPFAAWNGVHTCAVCSWLADLAAKRGLQVVW